MFMFRLQLIASGRNNMPEMDTDHSQRNDADNANSDIPTQVGEGQIQAGSQTCMNFLHNCGTH